MLNGAGVRAYVCAEAVDMRKSIDGLSALVGSVFAADPFSGHWFVFLSRSRGGNRVNAFPALPQATFHGLPGSVMSESKIDF